MFRVAALEVVVEGAAGTAPPHDQAGVAGEKWRGGKGEEAQEEEGGGFPFLSGFPPSVSSSSLVALASPQAVIQ